MKISTKLSLFAAAMLCTPVFAQQGTSGVKITKDKMASMVKEKHDQYLGKQKPAVWMGHVPIVQRQGNPVVSPQACDTVTSTFAGGNGQNGNMFDIVATNAVTITSFSGSFDNTSAASGTVKIYYKQGSYMGSENNAAAWMLIDSATVTSNGVGLATPIPIAVNIAIPAGQTYAFYITTTATGMDVDYTDGTTEGAVYASDANIQFLQGKGVAYPFGSNYTPRIWNGMIFYCTGSTSGIIDMQSVSASVVPNPFSTSATLSFGKTVTNAEVHMFDMIGKEVKRVDVANAASIELNREGLNAGMYFVRVIENGKAVSVQKVVIQ